MKTFDNNKKTKISVNEHKHKKCECLNFIVILMCCFVALFILLTIWLLLDNDNQTLGVFQAIGLELGVAAIFFFALDWRLKSSQEKTENKIKNMLQLRIQNMRFIPLFLKTKTKDKITFYEGDEVYDHMISIDEWNKDLIVLSNYFPDKQATIMLLLQTWLKICKEGIVQCQVLSSAYPDILSELIKEEDYISRTENNLSLILSTPGYNKQVVVMGFIKKLSDELDQFSNSFRASEGLY